MKRSEVSRGVSRHSAGAFDLQRQGVVSQEQTEGGAVEEQLLGERQRSLEGGMLIGCYLKHVTNWMAFSTGQTKRRLSVPIISQ